MRTLYLPPKPFGHTYTSLEPSLVLPSTEYVSPRLTPPPRVRGSLAEQTVPLGSSTETSISASPVQVTRTTQSRTTASCRSFKNSFLSASRPSLARRSNVAFAVREADASISAMFVGHAWLRI